MSTTRKPIRLYIPDRLHKRLKILMSRRASLGSLSAAMTYALEEGLNAVDVPQVPKESKDVDPDNPSE